MFTHKKTFKDIVADPLGSKTFYRSRSVSDPQWPCKSDLDPYRNYQKESGLFEEKCIEIPYLYTVRYYEYLSASNTKKLTTRIYAKRLHFDLEVKNFPKTFEKVAQICVGSNNDPYR